MQGGALVVRRNLPLRIWYQQKDKPNAYGEYHHLIKGLVMPAAHIPLIETRLHTYRIVKKKSAISDDVGQAVDVAFDLRGSSAPSRTRVNNCTEVKKQTESAAKKSPPDEPEQFEIGQMTREQKKQLAESLRHHRPIRKKSPADEFETLTHVITLGDCTDYDRRRAESYLKAAHEIRRQEKAMKPEGIKLAEQIQVWARIKNIQISKVQADRLACGEEVTALDTVYRAHPVTGELIATDINLPWRKILARHKTSNLINRWRLAVK
ncbi:MAG: hypothetical protein ACMZI0_12535 [Symbiopectobacterium sp.]|uniref:hypothetical protein n=1 Tax=Symbiopectobacterium sp. TaxID=2952789 RepID=UPI0039ED24E6